MSRSKRASRDCNNYKRAQVFDMKCCAANDGVMTGLRTKYLRAPRDLLMNSRAEFVTIKRAMLFGVA
jgi:hypothetical protein